ncbi:MAG: hypothetical protein JXA99_04385 [Candidatus Lokiarchaeota archaeon]|nr:hypothetical protein [Candidatus Lokiarchaeota archaeon]
MQKQKLTKFKAKLVIALFLINMVCIFGFGSSTLASESMNPQFDINEGYCATYDFEDELVGAEGTAISFVNSMYDKYGTVYAKITDSGDPHQYCLEMYEGRISSTMHVQNMFNTAINEGTVEFWWYPYQTTHTGCISLIPEEGSNYGIVIQYTNEGGWTYYNGQAWIDINGATYSALTWHHIKISWDCDDTYYKLFINNVDVSIAHGDELYYRGDSNNFDSLLYLRFWYGWSDNTVGKELFDAIGYSWDSNYNIGDNRIVDQLYEGDTVTLSWNLIDKECNDYVDGYQLSYTDYDTEIWIQKDSSEFTKIATLDFSGGFSGGVSSTQYYTLTIPIAGNYKFLLKEYSREKGYLITSEMIWHSIREDNLICEEETDVLVVDELLYNLNLIPNSVHQGEQTEISWNVDSKDEEGIIYETSLSLKYPGEETFQYISTYEGIGEFSYETEPLIELGEYLFHANLSLTYNSEIISTTSEFLPFLVNRIDIKNEDLSDYSQLEPLIDYEINPSSYNPENNDIVIPNIDNYYEIGEGDDKKPVLGFPLIYDTPADLDIFSQSILIQSVLTGDKTIIDFESSNDIIPFPKENGNYTIEILGHYLYWNTNTQGFEFHKCRSSQNTFEIEYEIEINNLKDGAIAVPDPGIYPATFGFEDENILFSNEYGFISDYDQYSDDEIRILDNLNGHQNILMINDPTNPNVQSRVEHIIKNPQSKGVIEFYNLFQWNDAPGSQTISFMDENDNLAFKIELEPEVYPTYSDFNINGFHGIVPYSYVMQNSWYHHSIEFDFDKGTQGEVIWILKDNEGEVINQIDTYILDTESSSKTIATIQIETSKDDSGYSIYFDAFGFSWDPFYNVGDNLQRGFEVTFDKFDSLGKIRVYHDNIISNELYSNSVVIPYKQDAKNHLIYISGKDSTGVETFSNIIDYNNGNYKVDVKIGYDSKAAWYIRTKWGQGPEYLADRVSKALNEGFRQYFPIVFRTGTSEGWLEHQEFTPTSDLEYSIGDRLDDWHTDFNWHIDKSIPGESSDFDLLIMFTFDDSLVWDKNIGGMAGVGGDRAVINLGWIPGGIDYITGLPVNNQWSDFCHFTIFGLLGMFFLGFNHPGILSMIMHEVGHCFGITGEGDLMNGGSDCFGSLESTGDTYMFRFSVMDYFWGFRGYHKVFDYGHQKTIRNYLIQNY